MMAASERMGSCFSVCDGESEDGELRTFVVAMELACKVMASARAQVLQPITLVPRCNMASHGPNASHNLRGGLARDVRKHGP
jgi:hypothetical protein